MGRNTHNTNSTLIVSPTFIIVDLKAYNLRRQAMLQYIVIHKEKYIYILQQVRRDILRLPCIKLLIHRLKIQPQPLNRLLSIRINHHAGIPELNNYKSHDKLGYSPICYIGSKVGWVSMREMYKLLDHVLRSF